MVSIVVIDTCKENSDEKNNNFNIHNPSVD